MTPTDAQIEAVAKAICEERNGHPCEHERGHTDSARIARAALAAIPEPATVPSVEHDVDYTSYSDEDGIIIYQCLHCGEAHAWGAIQDHVRAEHRPEPATVGGVTGKRLFDLIREHTDANGYVRSDPLVTAILALFENGDNHE